jgi:hypothetical protein
VSPHAHVYLGGKEIEGCPCGRNLYEEDADNFEGIRTTNYKNASVKRFPYTNQLGQYLAYFFRQKLLVTIFHIREKYANNDSPFYSKCFKCIGSKNESFC